MNYLIAKPNEKEGIRILGKSKAKSLSYLRSEWKRIEKMFSEYHSFQIVSEEELEEIEEAA